MKLSRFLTVSTMLPRDSLRVLAALESCVIVDCRASPLPARFCAPVVTSSDTAPFLFAPSGPSAVESFCTDEYSSSTSTGTIVLATGRLMSFDAFGPPV